MRNNKDLQKIKSKITAYLVVGMLGIVLFTATFAYSANQMPTDSYSFTVVQDNTAPYIEGCLPTSGATNVPRDTNIKFTIKDDISGVDRNSIALIVKGVVIISNGIIQTYQNGAGAAVNYNVEIIEKTEREYVIVYDPVDYFNYKQQIDVKINAADLDANSMNEYSYSFRIQTMVHGLIKKAGKSSSAGTASADELIQDNSRLTTANGGKNVYIVWEEQNSQGNWNIYFSKSIDFGENFTAAVKVNSTGENAENRYPEIAADTLENVYVAWQKKSVLGDQDIYIARLDNGNNEFGSENIIYNDHGACNQTHPVIDLGNSLTNDNNAQTQEPPTVYVCWLEENGAATTAVKYTRTTADYRDAWYEFVQTPIRVDEERLLQVCAKPALKIDTNGNILISWRTVNNDGTNSIYIDQAQKNAVDGGENFGTDFAVSSASAGAANPCLQICAGLGNVYLLWQEIEGNNSNLIFSDYQYDAQQGSFSLVNTAQVNETSITGRDLGGCALKINNDNDAFIVWPQEENGDWVINMAYASYQGYNFEAIAQFKDEGIQARRENPYLALDQEGRHYYISWTDEGAGSKEISICRNSFITTDAINANKIENDTGGSLNVGSGNIAGAGIEINQDAFDVPLQVTIAEVIAPPEVPSDIKTVGSVIDFGPGGTVFNKNARIKLPYTEEKLSAAGVTDVNKLCIYYYNLATSAWEKVSGTTVDNANRLVLAETGHFSMYLIAAEVESAGGDGGDNPPTPTGGDTPGNGGSGGGGGGGCFIATAAFGTPMAKEVRMLSKFRDMYLLTNPWGKKFVKTYYTYSPTIANYIAKKEGLKSIVRICLRPMIYLAEKLISS